MYHIKTSEEIIAKSKLGERQKCTKSSSVKFKQNELKEKHAQTCYKRTVENQSSNSGERKWHPAYIGP